MPIKIRSPVHDRIQSRSQKKGAVVDATNTQKTIFIKPQKIRRSHGIQIYESEGT